MNPAFAQSMRDLQQQLGHLQAGLARVAGPALAREQRKRPIRRG